MGTNSAPFILIQRGTISTYKQLENPRTLLTNSSTWDWPVILFYCVGYSAVYVFFFLSGFHAQDKLSEGSLGSYLESNYRKIYLPSIIFFLLYFPIWGVFNTSYVFSGENYLMEALIGSYDLGGSQINSPTWFLTPLFAAYALAPLFNKLHSNFGKKSNSIFLILIYTFGILLCWSIGPKYDLIYPMHLVLFFTLGMMSNKIDGQRNKSGFKKVLSQSMALILLCTIFMSPLLVGLGAILLGVSTTTLIHFLPLLFIVEFILFKQVVYVQGHEFIKSASRQTLYMMLLHYPFITFLSKLRLMENTPTLVFVLVYMTLTIFLSSVLAKFITRIRESII